MLALNAYEWIKKHQGYHWRLKIELATEPCLMELVVVLIAKA